MAQPKSFDPYFRKLEEIESNDKNLMTLQYEHNDFFRNELKEKNYDGVY